MDLAFLNIGTQEMVLIIIVILFLFGGKKLPELARGLGRGIREFKDASEGIKREITDQINNFEKDLDVEEDIKAIPPASNQKSTDIKAEMAKNGQQALADKPSNPALPTFGPPAGTYQHNPNGDVDPHQAYYDGSFDQQNAVEYTQGPDEKDAEPFVQPEEDPHVSPDQSGTKNV